MEMRTGGLINKVNFA